MAGYWEGFTEKELGFYLGNNEEEEKGSVSRRKANKLEGGKEGNSRTRKIEASTIDNKIPEEERLCEGSPEDKPLITEEVNSIISGSNQPVCLKMTDGNSYELIERDPRSVSPATLEVFQARQKMLEQQNKKRKEMLAKVLEDRKKQTSAEAKRLKNIQDELHKLDLILSSDVGILRNQIESASIEFGEAQKRYNKAEKEYLEAKQILFSKLERKELLTRHLCTIIEQNEMRKAQKLSELMERLRIDEKNLDIKSDLNAVIISPYYESALKDGTKSTEEKLNEPTKINS